MGYQVIPERDGNGYALFASECDQLVARNQTKRQVVEFFVEIARDGVERNVARIFEKIEVGEPPYFQFTLTLKEAEEMDRRARGATGGPRLSI